MSSTTKLFSHTFFIHNSVVSCIKLPTHKDERPKGRLSWGAANFGRLFDQNSRPFRFYVLSGFTKSFTAWLGSIYVNYHYILLVLTDLHEHLLQTGSSWPFLGPGRLRICFRWDVESRLQNWNHASCHGQKIPLVSSYLRLLQVIRS